MCPTHREVLMGVLQHGDGISEKVLASIMNNKNVPLECAIDAAVEEFGCSYDFVYGVYMDAVREWIGAEEPAECEDYYEPDGDVMSFENPSDVVSKGEFRLIERQV